MKNHLVAKILNDVSYALEILDVEFKPRAYARAARSVENLSKPIEDIYAEGGKKALDNIPGVGESIANKIEEIIKTRSLKYRNKLIRKIGFDFTELMNIEGLGPKMIKKLHEELGVKSLADLDKAAKEGRIRSLEGFGEKTEKKIMDNVEFARVKNKRVLLSTAFNEAQEVKKELIPFAEKVEVAGSIRRMKETIGDIDILAVAKRGKHEEIIKKFARLGKVVMEGETKIRIRLDSGLNCDLRIIELDSFGSALQYFTGSKDHSIELRKIAMKKGLKLSEYGLFKNDKKIAGRNEEEVYKKLGMQCVPPELRENIGEVELAQKNKIPELINYDAIKGDLQMHTKYSDGGNSVEEMVLKCKNLGYEYVGISDHAGNLKIANSMGAKEVSKQRKEIQNLNIKGIKVLQGAEVNILADGSLDVPDKLLKEFDFVIAAVHSKFNMARDEMTKRLIKAIKNPYVIILAHPTGRKVLRKESYDADWKEVFKAAKEHGVLLEINAHPERLDLPDSLINQAVKMNCALIINTDSHSVDNLEYMKFGIGQARRGGCTRKAVANALSFTKFLELLKK